MTGINTLDDLLGAIRDLHDAPTLPVLIERLERALSGQRAELGLRTSPEHQAPQVPRQLDLGRGLEDHADPAEPPADATEEREGRVVRLLAVAFQARFEELFPTAYEDMPLTPRERDVLRWFADGKSAEDVAVLMEISSGTVMFHYRRAADRLGTLNRTHTVVEAMRRGLIPLLPES